MIKGSLFQSHVTTLNAYTPNIRKCQAKIDRTGKTKKHPVAVEASTALCQ